MWQVWLVWFVGMGEACCERRGGLPVRRCGYGCPWWWDMAFGGEFVGVMEAYCERRGGLS
ncbi:hypothetical protein [Bartonella mastomydis]|uniref:hypothetical protein n=1 Tax=Bartonella mastomydis TaxID=1820002 RepID=UPI001116ECF1|nr:hypothetical protein [Bartonella mastomydis]